MTTIVPDVFVFTEWPSKRLDNKDGTGKYEEAFYPWSMWKLTTSYTPKCPSLRQLNFRALCFFTVYLLPLFASCLDPLESGILSGRRSRQINNPQADTKFTRTTISKKKTKKKRWLSKETSSLMVLDNSFFRRVGGLFLSPSVTCSNALQVLETHRLCHIDHCTDLLTGYL